MNKKIIFNDEKVIQRITDDRLVLVKADLSDLNPVVAKDLSRVDRVQIPVNLIYPPDQEAPAILLEANLYPRDAMKALDKAGF